MVVTYIIKCDAFNGEKTDQKKLPQQFETAVNYAPEEY
jgi:hypothetical protein